MAYLTRTGRVPDPEMRSYLSHLLVEMRPQAPHYVWVGWVLAVALLGYEDLAGGHSPSSTRCGDRAQRPVPLRQQEEVQEVLPALTNDHPWLARRRQVDPSAWPISPTMSRRKPRRQLRTSGQPPSEMGRNASSAGVVCRSL